ncbi:sigma factor-like helix-turn-helix DNA-binding protein [Micromonospora sp. DH14]|uniref:sigma factor-like helix-turn-helix DNA-binding protein n=1 Tax=Micromonospora sp. DH14 TaxID=3040120 RepID=UPI002442F060|nr:sigma factor-like helix-turn-helix DNA-binding protein [Micromonospora sp. DH14]MDG9678824.1 sigma factor-like helix-turn-helix DNA-binding protein [Micromonospora sp. DH14]
MDDPAALAKIADPRERASAAHQLIDDYQAAIGELSRIRRESLEELLSGGMTQTQIADMLHMSRSRVSQLLSAGLRPERAFLGAGRLTVSIGGKQEVGRSDPGDVISAESFSAYNTLAELARSVGLDAGYEVVPPPGHVHLNRPNLIVMTSPRLLPFLGQIMEADPKLRFVSDERGWFIKSADTDEEYRSPRDSGHSADYGYIGRLPRPDGKGSFLYLAGIHAQGTLGAAHFIADNIGQLYKELKNRRFSTVVRSEYDGKKLLSVERVTPLYRHEGGN